MRYAGAYRAVLGAFVAVAALLPAGAGAAGPLLEPEDAPGLNAAGGGKKVAVEALAGKSSKPLRKAPAQGAAFRADDRRLAVGVFTLDSEKAAKKALRAVGRGGKSVDLGDGAFERATARRGGASASVGVRVGPVIGAVRFEAPLTKDAVAEVARSYARLLVGRISSDNAWDRALAAVGDDGSVTPEVALRAFAIAYGPIPGVKRPKGLTGAPEPTVAATLVLRVWDQLNPEQRAAVESELEASYNPASAAPDRAAERAQRAMTPNPGYEAAAILYAAALEARLGMPRPEIRVFNESNPIPNPIPGLTSAVLAEALPFKADGEIADTLPADADTSSYCRIRVPPAGQTQGQAGIQNTIAHEVAHCFQFRFPAWKFQPFWIREGTASWAGDSLTGTELGHYKYYLYTPTRPLFDRNYDANGFWGHADDVAGAGSLWQRLPAIFGLGAGEDAAAFAAAGGGTAPFDSTWASAMFRIAGAGPAWNQTSPFSLSFLEFPLTLTPITNSTTFASNPYSTTPHLVGGNPDKALVNVLRLEGRLRAAKTTNDFGEVDSEWFCQYPSKCKCPPGKASSIPDHIDVGPSLLLALTGGPGPGSGRVTYHDPKKFCDDSPPADNGPAGPGETNGDPHMTTLDSLNYDFQAAGEFTLVKSDSGDLEIQARQEPWEDSKRVTINSQIAMGVEGRRVTVTEPSNAFEPPTVRIDGTVDPLPPGESRALGGGSVRRDLDRGYVTVTWPDGSNVVVRPVGSSGVAARIELAPSRAGAVSGVLGNFDGDPDDDLRTRGGRGIPYRSKPKNGFPPFVKHVVAQEFERKFFDDLYEVFGESWRIEQGESLFDYAPGQSTKTFTDRSIPAEPFDPADFSRRRREAAERICRAHGVTDPVVLQDCITDILATGDEAFAVDAFAAQESVRAAWSRLAAGVDRGSSLSLLRTGDGSLHVGYEQRLDASSSRMVDVPLDPTGAEGPSETIGAAASAPFLFAAPDGSVRAESAELRSSGSSGIYQYARSADGTWNPLGPVATGGFTYASTPNALFAGDTLFSVSPMAGVARLYRGAPAGPGVEPTASLPDCYATSPALARDGATGEVWLAWVQWDCPQGGVFVQQVDRSSGQLLGSPQLAPGTATDGSMPVDVSLGAPIAFTGRAGDAGVFLAYSPGPDDRVALWRVGDPEPTSIPREEGSVGQVLLSAEPQGGKLWVAWTEDDRLWTGRSSGGALDADPRPLDPPPGVVAPLFSGRHWDMAAANGALDVFYGYGVTNSEPGQIWRARVLPG